MAIWTGRAAAALVAFAGFCALPGDASAAGEADGRPSLTFGQVLHVDLRATIQADWRDADPFDLHRARVGIEGHFLKYFEYQVERELDDASSPWRDVYLNARLSRAVQLQAGQFKMPFSHERLTGTAKLDFAYRSLAATYLAPGRQRGVMVHGSLIDGVVKYQSGVFYSDHADRTVAGRFSVRPWHRSRGLRALKGVRVGLAMTSGQVAEGSNSIRGRTVFDETLFHRVMVSGARTRVGAEVEWKHGPLSLTGEVMRVADQRRGQGTDDGDLPDAVARGWYLSAAWRVADRLPARLGGLELAGRIEDVRLGGGNAGRPGSVSMRAADILEHGDRVVTAGINWSPNRWTRVQANVIRERRRVGGAAIGDASWSPVVRLQVAL